MARLFVFAGRRSNPNSQQVEGQTRLRNRNVSDSNDYFCAVGQWANMQHSAELSVGHEISVSGFQHRRLLVRGAVCSGHYFRRGENAGVRLQRRIRAEFLETQSSVYISQKPYIRRSRGTRYTSCRWRRHQVRQANHQSPK